MKNMRCVKKKGFTLIEILLVLSIISVIVLLGVSSYSIVRKKVRLDIAANSFESVITEARDSTRSGYYRENGNVSEAPSVCFGFSVEQGKYIELLETTYDRLGRDVKCSRNQQDINELSIGDIDENIEIKQIELFGSETAEEITVFFRPPDAKPEILNSGIDQNAILRIVIGFEDSDNPLDKREVVFNALTSNVYTQKFNAEEQ